MEGTRNERVAILVLSYVIGFVTAYVAFGITQLQDSFVYVPVENSASVIAAVNQKNNAPGLVAETKDGLVFIKNDRARILSAQAAAEDGVLSEGYHTRIADYSLSPDGKHVYFCEVPANDIDACRPYVYSVADDTVYPFKVEGQRVAFSTHEHAVSWDAGGSLVFDNAH